MVLGYILLGAAVLLCFSLALSFAITRRHPQKVISNPGEYGLAFEEIHFPTRDNLQLQGWWIPSDNSRRTIIFLHGFNGSMDPDLKYVPDLVAAGYNIMMFDFRTHGRSEGKLTSLGAVEVRDAEAAIRYAQNRGIEKIGLLGFSMGGRVALLTASRIPVIAAVVSDGGPLKCSTALTEGMKNKGIPWGIRHLLAWLMMLGISLRAAVNLFGNDPIRIKPGAVTIPTLLVHGECDSFTTRKDLEKMVKTLGTHAKLWVVPGVGHRETDEPDFRDYLNRLIIFFDECL